MMTMGVTSFILVFSLLLFEVTFVHTLDEGEETTTTQKIREEKREPPTIEIGVTVVSNRHSLETNNSQENSEFWILVDTWWKILAWSSAVLLLSGLCCYFSKCCYLCWDCCSDPFWGCFPRSEGCLRCLSMRGCSKSRSQKKKKGGYTICQSTPPQKTAALPPTKRLDHDPENPEFSEADDEENEVENYTLRTVESLEVDAMLDKFSPIKGPKKANPNHSKMVTSTPRKKSKEKKTRQEMDAIFLELSGEAESQPQVYPTHYFNILNIFGIGCSNYKVSTVEERHKKSMTVQTTTISSGIQEDSTLGLVSDEEEILIEDRSFDRSVLNNQDFPLSSSFNNMYKKNGLHIEEGQVGRYHPLPEAKFELLPPEELLRKVKRQNSLNFHRRSRSMENFRNHLSPSKKYSSTSLHPKQTEQSRFLEEDESSLPSPPPVPSVVAHSHQPAKIVPCHNGNLSSTTTDEENDSTHQHPGHRRNHSAGSRIGHRRTPSMEGVAQIQNGLKRNGKRHPDLPPKAPVVLNQSHPSTSQSHKKRYSHRKMRLIDIDDDMERYILYGKETTL